MTLEARFWAKVDRSGGPTACWPWTGSATDGRGYGVLMGPGRKHLRAPRLSLALAGRPVPDGWDALHSCDNPPCVNPAHLRAGTPADNVRDALLRGRWSTIENLRPGLADDIRARHSAGHSIRRIARDLRVGRPTVGRVTGAGYTRGISRDDRRAVEIPA